MVATDLLRALDPAVLATEAGLSPDPWQAELLRTDAKQILMNCSRQSGKSSVAGFLAVHELLYRPEALVLALSPTERQSGELLRKVKEGLTALGTTVPEAKQESALRLELPNRSRVIGLPGAERTVRCYSGVSLLLIDEAARTPDDLYQAVRPMLAVSGGRIVLLSTPWGQRGFFFSEWQEGQDWHRVKITAHDCPRIDPAWLEAERQRIPEAVFRSEYLGEFVQTTDAVFRYADVMGAMREEIEPWFPLETQETPIPPPRLLAGSWG